MRGTKLKKGNLIALFGTDGTGKSTVADLIEAKCKERGIKTQRYHWRPRLLPSRKVDRLEIDVTRPDELVERPWAVSLVTYSYFFFDFLLAYFFKFSPFIKSGGVILYERYYYDIVFHPRRYRAKEIGIVADRLVRVLPKPDIIVQLFGEPKVIQSRKPELSVTEIARQQELMDKYLPDFGPVLRIDVTSRTPQDIAQIVIEELFVSMN